MVRYIWSIMSITSRTMLETLDTLRSRARQRTRQVLLAEHVHRDWAVNTSKEPPESSMNRGIDLSTNPNSPAEIFGGV